MHSRKARYTDSVFLESVAQLIADGMTNNQIANILGCGWHTAERARHVIACRFDKVKARVDKCDICGRKVLLEGKAINCDECQMI